MDRIIHLSKQINNATRSGAGNYIKVSSDVLQSIQDFDKEKMRMRRLDKLSLIENDDENRKK